MKLDGFGIFVKDMAAMVRFYRDVLGFKIKGGFCSLIEYIASRTKNKRGAVVEALGESGVRKQLNDAQVNHCLSFEQVSDEVIEQYQIKGGILIRLQIADTRFRDSTILVGYNLSFRWMYIIRIQAILNVFNKTGYLWD